MKKMTFLLFVVSVFGCNSDESGKNKSNEPTTVSGVKVTLSEEEIKDGWQLLFDGATKNGWHKYGGKVTGDAWKVVDGTLHLDASEKEDWQTKGGGDIFIDEEYGNFDLKLEWKIDTCGNSGIIIFTHEDSSKYTRGWETGPEMQVLDNKCHPDAQYPTHRAGCLYDLMTVAKETVKPALEWNEVEIKTLDGKLDFWLNGENVISTTMWDDNWKKMIAGSKFKDHPDFGTFKQGRIGLQDHGNNVWFRNIRIKKL